MLCLSHVTAHDLNPVEQADICVKDVAESIGT